MRAMPLFWALSMRVRMFDLYTINREIVFLCNEENTELLNQVRQKQY
ncbi:MAG: hypothetical protein AAE985_06410 [Thermoplasmataceae archaeon]|jgi:hypothetical protein